MAQTWPELMAKARHADIAPEQLLGELLAAETASGRCAVIAYQMTAARFPAHRDLAGFRFAESRVDEELIRRLHTGQFMDDAQNVVFIGGPGTARRIWRPPSASRRSSARDGGCGSFQPWNW